MYLKKIIARPLILFLTVSQCMTAYAGTWACRSQNEWKYQNDDGTYQKGGWFQDPADGHRYYLAEDGVIMTGWIYRDDTWYYLNTVHNGLFGAALTDGWHWIDGYCYYFDQTGRMYRESTTPDGFIVDGNGRWTENGVAVHVKGRGVMTEGNTGTAAASGRRSSGGGGGGGSGGGSSKGSNSSTEYYGYSVYYVEENGSPLETLTGEALKNSFVEIEIREYPGYVFLEGENGKQKLTRDNASYTLIYRKEEHQNTEPEAAEQYGYTIHYIDSSDGKELKVKKGLAEKGSWITVSDTYLSGYEANEGNNYAFSLSEDNTDIYLYYTKQEKTLDYTIRYIGSDGMLLGSIEGKAPVESVVDIPERWFDGYEKKEGQRSRFVLTSDAMVVKVLYEKEPGEEVATPSEPEEKDCVEDRTAKCI